MLAPLCGPLRGQSPPLASIVRGNIVGDRPATAAGPLLVELENPQGRQVHREHTALDGSFEFRMLPAGTYNLRITTLHGDLVRQQLVTIGEHNEPLSVTLPPTPGSVPAQGTISAARLRPIPSRARKEFRESQKLMGKGDLRGSIARLEAAIRIEPAYMEAHNNLGTRYMALGQPENALREFQTAAAIDPGAARVQANLAIVLLALKRFAEAEAPARNAVRLDPLSLHGVYTLGLALEALGTVPEEALGHLSRVLDKFPNARLAAARLLLRMGRGPEAAAELRAYLAIPDAPHRQSVLRWLAQREGNSAAQ